VWVELVVTEHGGACRAGKSTLLPGRFQNVGTIRDVDGTRKTSLTSIGGQLGKLLKWADLVRHYAGLAFWDNGTEKKKEVKSTKYRWP
jgi:hypothetical protein